MCNISQIGKNEDWGEKKWGGTVEGESMGHGREQGVNKGKKGSFPNPQFYNLFVGSKTLYSQLCFMC